LMAPAVRGQQNITARSVNTTLYADQLCATPGQLDQSCLINAISALPVSGGTIRFAHGTYTLNSTVTVTKPVKFETEAPAASFVVNGIAFGSYVPSVRFLWNGASSGKMMSITDVTGVEFGSVVFDCNNLASVGLELQSVQASSFNGTLTFVGCIAGSPDDAALQWVGGVSGHANVQWNAFSNITCNGVAKCLHVYSPNLNTDAAVNTVRSFWCTLTGATGNYCYQLDAADNNTFIENYFASASGASGSAIVLNGPAGTNDGARSNYFFHIDGNVNMNVISNVAAATGYNYVYGYDSSNGLADVSGTHPGTLITFGSTDKTRMVRLPNNSTIAYRNAADSAWTEVLRLDQNNTLVLHSGGLIQMWNAAESTVPYQFGDSQADFNVPLIVHSNFVATGSKSSAVDTASHGKRLMYAIESPENWFEDFGTGKLSKGKAIIELEPIFAQTVSVESEYHVFLTPRQDCGGLYVVNQTARGFEVREAKGGRGNFSFDYRIVAKRRGYEKIRLENGPTGER